MARKAASKVGRGTVVIPSPRSWTAASSLKAPGSPWKATRILRMIALLNTGTPCAVFYDVLAAEAIHIGCEFEGGGL